MLSPDKLSRTSGDQSAAVADNEQGRLSRREFLKLAAVGGAGFAIRTGSYRFDWSHDVPPSLMLHSGNVEYLPDLLPRLLADFNPLTYRDWLDRLARLEAFAGMIARFFRVEQGAVAEALARRPSSKLPLIISIDDVGTDWIRWEHLRMFEILLEQNIQAVVGVQPKVMPEEQGQYWQRLLELHRAGWEIASHSINHPPLTQINQRNAAFEIFESCDRIEQVSGQRPITLIAPFGDAEPADRTSAGNVQLYRLAQEAGLQVIAGIRDGRKLLSQSSREELRTVYGGEPIPEYVGRIAPDSRAEATMNYLQYFNGEGYRS